MMEIISIASLMAAAGLFVSLGKESDEASHFKNDITKKKMRTLLPAIMKREGIDLWLIFTREESKDPMSKDFGAGNAVARMALLFYLEGDALAAKAIAASYDITPLQDSGFYNEIISYKAEGIKPHLLEAVQQLNPQKIALNYSRDIPIADGLAHGMRNYLAEVWGPEYDNRVVSAEPLLISFRSAKLPEEIEIMRTAVKITEQIIAQVLTVKAITAGKTTEKDLARFMEKKTKAAGAEVEFNSINVGKTRGHSDPTDLVIQEGDLIRIDFGIRFKGYCTDLQRCAYILKKGETKVPAEIEKMFEVTKIANRAAVAELKPGRRGLDVDQAARKVLIANAYKEYPHGTGHAIGFEVHDVGPMLGPDWKERYGSGVFKIIEAGQTFAVEPLIYEYYEPYDGDIHVSIEEDVLVTAEGAEYLSTPQEKMIILKMKK